MAGIAAVPGRGRPPKPAAQKLADGNPGKRKIPTVIDYSAPITGVDPPEWLDDTAREMWERIAPALCEARVLNITDLHNLESFCTAYSLFRRAEAALVNEGLTVASTQGGVKKNPLITIITEAKRQMMASGSVLGLDPASRQRVLGTRKETAKTNIFAQIKNRK